LCFRVEKSPFLLTGAFGTAVLPVIVVHIQTEAIGIRKSSPTGPGTEELTGSYFHRVGRRSISGNTNYPKACPHAYTACRER
jgi:hypothetical protein